MAAVLQDAYRKLPVALQDMSQWMQVSRGTWTALLEATGESARFSGQALTYGSLLASFVENPPNDAMFHIIETLFELGSDAGRVRLLQAAEDRQVDLATSDEETTPELVARFCLKSLTHEAVQGVIMLALVNVREGISPRAQQEFAGPRAASGQTLTRETVRQSVASWCQKNGKNDAVEILTSYRDGIWHCEILRGEPLKRVPEIRDNKVGMLTFRPCAADHVEYDPQTGRLRIATRSPQLCRAYRELFGTLIGQDPAFFAGNTLYTLKPLKTHGSALFETARPSAIHRIDVVELRAKLNDREDLFVRGRDCFRVLQEFGANLQAGELTDARLKMFFAGDRLPGLVSIKVPNRLVIKASGREEIIERLLRDIGIIGAFDEGGGQPTHFWLQYPWRMHESDWRPRLDSHFDTLHQRGFFQHVILDKVRDPGSPSTYLTVKITDNGTYAGISDDLQVPPRTLTLSDVQGFQLDVSKVLQEIRSQLTLAEISQGLWNLGTRAAANHELRFLLATRPLSEAGLLIMGAQTLTERVVLLVPKDCPESPGVPSVTCRIPTGPYDTLWADVLIRTSLQDFVPLPEWRMEDFLLDNHAGQAWYRSVLLTKLAANSHPFKFAREVARANRELVTHEHLRKTLSQAHNTDPQVVKKARSHFTKAVRDSYDAAGKVCPPEIATLFESRSSYGYLLRGTAHVRM